MALHLVSEKTDALTRIGNLDAQPAPQHASAVLPTYEPPTDEDWARLEGMEAIRRVCEQFGYARVATWVRSLASIAGQDIERPTDRCLADGAPLINQICVQCGRDNQ